MRKYEGKTIKFPILEDGSRREIIGRVLRKHNAFGGGYICSPLESNAIFAVNEWDIEIMD